MVRTQIYLTERERKALIALSAATGKKKSELIREAVDRLIEQFGKTRRQAILDSVAGMWQERNDLPDFDSIRKYWDRNSDS